MGPLEQKAAAYAAARDQLAARQVKAAQLPALRQKLEFDQDEHAKLTVRVDELEAKAGSVPRVGLVHDLASCLSHLWASEASKNVAFGIGLDIKEVLAVYERQYGKIGATGDAEATRALPKAIEARDLMARSVENDRRDIAAAEAAAGQMQEGTAPEAVQPADVEAARAKVAELRAERKVIDERVQQLLNAKRAATSATERTANAAQYHQDVLAWSAIGDALSPDGIPGEILAEALQPVNDKLADLADLAGWRVPAIDPDMAITFAGRPYRLLSESERWRVDALVGAALAEISGLRCLILDRFDCLDLPGRSDALGLVDALAADGRMDTVLVLGTLKAAPAAPSNAFTAHWIDQGHAGQAKLREAASPPRHQSLEMQIARRQAAEHLRKIGAPVKESTTVLQMAAMIAERTGWPAPASAPADLLAFLERFLDQCSVGVTPPPYRPVVRRPMRYDLAMREALHPRRRCAAAPDHGHEQRDHLEGIGSMSFYTTIARLREATHSDVAGEAPDSCLVSREDLRIALYVIDRLEADARQTGLLSHATMDRAPAPPGAGSNSRPTLATPTRRSPRVRSLIEIVVPFTASLGTAGELHLRHSDDFGDKAHLSIDVGHPLNGSRASASLSVGSMPQLTDGLMDFTHAIERNIRLQNKDL
ncbi:hypothetical protein [Achromobacter marplatensis]|uniref:hypothetical protein n=1 Tax=Achromobacter marplatensis TaxID=470868 RepID=UPI003C71F7FE